jgi:NADPH-dependent 2,4-dienoyl-CoA reductase/sulfur reductase-like enzyme
MINILKSDVLVIGGGPAGIAAAVELKRRGVQKVTLIEREPSAGGVPRHCGHPPFGMREFGRIYSGPAYAARLVEFAIENGVDIQTGTTVTRLEPGGQLQLVNAQGRSTAMAQRVVLATGIRETPRSARFTSGDRPVGVINTGALQAYVYLRGLMPFRRPLIVGTELVAISAVLTCLKAGIRPVGIVEANSRPTTYRPFAFFPRLLGIPVFYGTQIEEIQGMNRVESVKVRLSDDTFREVDCDGVLFTGRFTPEASLVRSSHLCVDSGTGGPQIDQYGRCSDRSYFAAGNLLRPIETAGWSFREGRRIGAMVADDLDGALPQIHASASVEHGNGIKLVVPQRITLPLVRGGLDHIQVRVDQRMRGRLTITADGKPLWSRKISALPERRILVPLADLSVPEHTNSILIELKACL